MLKESVKQLACRENKCKCPNGVVAKYCPEHHTSSCVDCKSGYHLEDNQCVMNICTCAFGAESTGVECETHQAISCYGNESAEKRLDQLNARQNDLTNIEVMEKFRIICESSADCRSLPHTPDESCSGHDVLNGVESVGVGFDGTKDYNLESVRKVLIQKNCVGMRGFSILDTTYCSGS